LGENATEIFKMFAVAFGKQTLGTTQLFPSSPPPTQFKSGLTFGESVKHSTHPLISK
jgi:hypothetical protein